MKKVILGLVLLLISTTIFACHNDAKGSCGGQAFFYTRVFTNGCLFQFRYKDSTDILFEYVTPESGNTDTLFSVQEIGNHTAIAYRWKAIGKDDSTYTEWQYSYSVDSAYSGCSLLPVALTNIGVQKTESGYKVQFSNENESDVSHYDIKFSTDQNTWDTKKTVLPGQHNYSITISFDFSFMFLPFLVGFKKRRWIGLLIIAMILFISCKKDSQIVTGKDYKYMKITAVSNDGKSTDSGIKSIK